MLTKIKKALYHLKQQHLLREHIPVEKNEAARIRHADLTHIDFSSSDYLSLCHHPQIKNELLLAVQQHGSGSAASPVISGYCPHTKMLEETAAQFFKRDRALFFNSGYHANIGIFHSIANRNTIIFSDKFCHASILDGILLSRAKHMRFQHLDLNHLEYLLKKHPEQPKIIVSESIFSMQGHLADVKQLSVLASQYQALLIIDDAHGFGILGNHGGGIIEQLALSQNELPITVVPLGKAGAGMGALVCGQEEYMQAILQHARSYKYSTALPGYISQTLLKTFRLIKEGAHLRKKLHALILFFNEKCKKINLPLLSYDQTPIRIIPIGSAENTLILQKKMRDQGFFIAAIRPPTVPVHHSCIRISLNAEHTNAQIEQLLYSISKHLNPLY